MIPCSHKTQPVAESQVTSNDIPPPFLTFKESKRAQPRCRTRAPHTKKLPTSKRHPRSTIPQCNKSSPRSNPTQCRPSATPAPALLSPSARPTTAEGYKQRRTSREGKARASNRCRISCSWGCEHAYFDGHNVAYFRVGQGGDFTIIEEELAVNLEYSIDMY